MKYEDRLLAIAEGSRIEDLLPLADEAEATGEAWLAMALRWSVFHGHMPHRLAGNSKKEEWFVRGAAWDLVREMKERLVLTAEDDEALKIGGIEQAFRRLAWALEHASRLHEEAKR